MSQSPQDGASAPAGSEPCLDHISSDDGQESVTEFRGSSPPLKRNVETSRSSRDLNEECGNCEDGANLKSLLVHLEDRILEEIPFVHCFPGIVQVLERFNKPTEPENALTVHRKLVLFINAIITCPQIASSEADYIFYALEKYPYLTEIMTGNSLYMEKILGMFKEDQERDPIVLRNNLLFLSKMQQIVLEKMDKCRMSEDSDWDASDCAVDYLLAFTHNASCMKWLLEHLNYVQVSDFLLQLIVDFYCRSEFTVIVAEWLQSTNLVEDLIGLFEQTESPHMNVSTVLEGLLDLCRIHRRTRGSNLANKLYNSNLISLLSASLLTLLKMPASDNRDDGVVQGFKVLSRLLRLEDHKPSAHRTEYRRGAIAVVTNNREFMEAIDKVLRLGGPKTYFQLTSRGTSPLGRVRRALLGFAHDIVVHADRRALKTVLELPTLEYLIKYLFWLHPFNSFVHLKVRSIITVLLRSNITKAAEMLVLQSNFLEGAMEFLNKPNPPGQQRAHIMRIVSVWVNYRHTSVVKDAMDNWMGVNPNLQSEWEKLVFKDLQSYLRKQGTLLAGVPKPSRKSPERALSR